MFTNVKTAMFEDYGDVFIINRSNRAKEIGGVGNVGKECIKAINVKRIFEHSVQIICT